MLQTYHNQELKGMERNHLGTLLQNYGIHFRITLGNAHLLVILRVLLTHGMGKSAIVHHVMVWHSLASSLHIGLLIIPFYTCILFSCCEAACHMLHVLCILFAFLMFIAFFVYLASFCLCYDKCAYVLRFIFI